MDIKKTVFNKFIFIWILFGFLIFSYTFVNDIINNNFSSYGVETKILILLPLTIFTLYIIAYIRYKTKN